MNVSEFSAVEARATEVAVDPIFLERWSPRALSGETISEEQIQTLIEAARWAPSCFNAQPWRFAYASAEQTGFKALFETLLEGNQAWVKNAGALIAVVSRSHYEQNGKPAPTHSFDAGAAWMSIALQASRMGLVTHAMQGFDQEQARQVLSVPDVYDLPAIIAVGHPGDVSVLPEDYQARETPSGRKPMTEILFKENFNSLTEKD